MSAMVAGRVDHRGNVMTYEGFGPGHRADPEVMRILTENWPEIHAMALDAIVPEGSAHRPQMGEDIKDDIANGRIRTSATARDYTLTWVPMTTDENHHGYGLPWMLMNDVLYIADKSAYHSHMMDKVGIEWGEAGFPPDAVAGRIDRWGNVIVMGGEFEHQDYATDVLQNNWPEIEAEFKNVPRQVVNPIGMTPEEEGQGDESDMYENISELGWPNMINVKEMYDHHQELNAADPTLKQAATKVRYVTTKDGTEYTDEDDPVMAHSYILERYNLNPADIIDAGGYDENGEKYSLWYAKEHYHQLWKDIKTSSDMTPVRLKRMFSDQDYGKRPAGWKAVVLRSEQSGKNEDLVMWWITDYYDSPHHADVIYDLNDQGYDNLWSGQMWGDITEGIADYEHSSKYVGYEDHVIDAVNAELQHAASLRRAV
jgi:hypothetical protein